MVLVNIWRCDNCITPVTLFAIVTLFLHGKLSILKSACSSNRIEGFEGPLLFLYDDKAQGHNCDVPFSLWCGEWIENDE